MKVVDLETRISIRDMLISPDRDSITIGWCMFVDEYKEEIIRRIKLHIYPDLASRSLAIDYLNRSISRSKYYQKKKNESDDSR
jgi:hypothetical protein